MRFPRLSGGAFAIGGALLMWSCGGGSSAGATPTAPSATSPNITVNIVASSGSGAFNPNPVPAPAGDTVAFKNNTSTMHHIVFDDGSADLGDITPGATSRTFTAKAGSSSPFHCTIHPSMVGSINGPIPAAPPCPGGPGYC